MSPIVGISNVYSNISSPMKKCAWNKPIAQDNSLRNFKKTTPLDIEKHLPWLRDKAIISALAELRDLKFDDSDIRYLKKMGVNVPYRSGADAVSFIEKQNIRILFDKPTDDAIHAQYDFGRNIITINEKYKNTQDFAVILAIGEAILHETGHAKDNDGDSSIQEELDFLGMNAIAHRAFLKKYGNVFSDASAPIIRDGVSVYAKLFFENDETKKNLIERMKIKYGDLPSGDGVHPPSKLAMKIKNDYNIMHNLYNMPGLQKNVKLS